MEPLTCRWQQVSGDETVTSVTGQPVVTPEHSRSACLLLSDYDLRSQGIGAAECKAQLDVACGKMTCMEVQELVGGNDRLY